MILLERWNPEVVTARYVSEESDSKSNIADWWMSLLESKDRLGTTKMPLDRAPWEADVPHHYQEVRPEGNLEIAERAIREALAGGMRRGSKHR